MHNSKAGEAVTRMSWTGNTAAQIQSFYIINLGCKVNKVEADSMTARLLQAGAQLSSLAEARVVLINTCTVTGEADTKSRKALRRAQREAPHALIIVCGCGATASPEQFDAVERVEIIPNKDEALERASEVLCLESFDAREVITRVGRDFNTRVAIKVQDGCDHACTYCIVPRARGSARSMPLQQVLRDISVQVEAGAREIVLTGIDLGSYKDGAYSLEHLLRETLTLGRTFRIRLSSIELLRLSDELIELIAASRGRICAHLHIPLQSGSDTILRAMNRNYDSAAYLQRIERIKARLPQVALTTDVIVGFPGETKADYEATYDICKEIGFTHIHVFRYSKRPGTPAAEMPDEVSTELVIARAERLRNLSVQLAREDALCRIGSSECVLYESENRGRSESYYLVRIAKSAPQGKLATMRILDYTRGELVAEECEE